MAAAESISSSGSAQGSDSSTDSIVIHLYQDVNILEKDPFIRIPLDKSLLAETICLQVAKHLSIGPRAFPCFALAKPDLSLWLPPNEKIHSGEVEYVFRMRFIPSDDCLNAMVNSVDEAAYNYLYLQLRDDFVNGRVTYKTGEDGKQISQAHLLGLSVIDMLRLGKERDLDLKQMTKTTIQHTKKFIPISEKKSFHRPWDRKRLVFNLNNNLEKVYNECRNQTSTAVKRRFIRGFLNYVDDYGVEQFTLTDSRKLRVNPHHPQYPAIYIEDANTVSPTSSDMFFSF